MELSSKIESLLFVAGKPLATKKLAELLAKSTEEIDSVLAELKTKYNQPASGIHLLHEGKEWQLATNPENSKLIKEYIQDETTGELTRPSLEALTIIAYRGPITKLELEQIRGVNCSLILRNLEMRGLVQSEEDKTRAQQVYSVTLDFLRFLGVDETSGLPDFAKLHNSELLQKLLADAEAEAAKSIV
jgi:segregation and condensation protein B